MNADHASVARFRSSSDPTYCSIREILLGRVTDIEEDRKCYIDSGASMSLSCSVLNPERVESHMRILSAYLNIQDTEDEDFARLKQRRVPGSCEWILEKPEFIRWRDRNGPHSTSRHQIYWLSGDPGCGKSFLATNIISHLQDRHCDVSYYFVKHGDITKQNIGSLLKSIAYQTARNSPSLRRSLLSMQREDTLTAEPSDLRAIWKQLFIQRIFRTDLEKHQYWIVDALDEGNGNGSRELVSLLQSLPQGYSVFVTCRRDQELERELRFLEGRLMMQRIDRQDTLRDIRTYLEYNEDDLHVDDSIQMQTLIRKLVEKSRGSFLWTHLIVQELSNYWTDDDFETVLNNVPDGMHYLYARMLQKIARSVNRNLAKAILRWVICATRPMSIAEIRTAFRLDTTQVLKRSARAIESICGPLLAIDKGRVEVVHDTVRDFLFNKGGRSGQDVDPDFLFDKGSSHERIAIVCITFMSTVFRAPLGNPLPTTSSDADDSEFLEYACKNFSEHVVKSSSADETDTTEKLMRALIEFFRGPVLLWIQRQAQERTLLPLTRTAKNIKAFVARRLEQSSRLAPHLHDIREWANDLIHLATVFGKHLLKKPLAIHTVIPPLCPLRSMIYSDLGHSKTGLRVVGLSRSSWSDQISSVSFGRDYTTALACCERYYSVALRSQEIVLYYATTCQEARRIKTKEAVIKRLEFANSAHWLVAGGRTTLTVHDYETGDDAWTITTPSEILAIAVKDDDTIVMTVNREKQYETFDMRSGQRLEHRRLEGSDSFGKPPTQVHISYEMRLIAVLYREDEIELYDLQTLRRSKERLGHSAHVDTIAFNPALNMLAFSSFNGEIVTIDLFTMRAANSSTGNSAHMAVSTDGKTLVVGTKQGDIHIHDFESLSLQHEIRYGDEEIVGLKFTGNSLRFLDIRRHIFSVWEPAALVRRSDDDESGSSFGHSTFSTAPSQLIEALNDSENSPISALVAHHSTNYLFCGREDGSIVAYETVSGKKKQKFDLGKSAVSHMDWNSTQNLLACADSSTAIRIYQALLIQARQKGVVRQSWQVKEVLSKIMQQPIRQVLFSVSGNLLLIATSTRCRVIRVDNGSEVITVAHNSASGTVERAQTWVVHHRHKNRFLDIQAAESRIITWDDDGLKNLRQERISISERIPSSTNVSLGKAQLIQIPGPLHLWAVYVNNPVGTPICWSPANQSVSVAIGAAATEQTLRGFGEISSQIGSALAIYGPRLVFVSSDSWVASIRIDNPRSEGVVRYHFPMPHYWRSSSRSLMALVTNGGDVVFAVDGEVAIVKQALLSEL